MSAQGLHQGQPVLHAGTSLGEAQAAVIMLHGRGATAEGILSLSAEFSRPSFAFLAPRAANNQWYPQRFMMPVATNEPYLSSALGLVDTLVNQVVAAGIPTRKIMLLGFSQGACLGLEYAARNPQRYGGVVGLSGGLIGDVLPVYGGSMQGTPVFLGCSDQDFHIPSSRVVESSDVFRALGAEVTVRLYPNMGHTVNDAELSTVSQMMASLDGI